MFKLQDAVHRGLHTRIGLEDMLLDSDGTPISGHAELVRMASQIRAERDGKLYFHVRDSNRVIRQLVRWMR